MRAPRGVVRERKSDVERFELIKHILELLYEDMRSPSPRLAPLFDKLEGETLAYVFRPFFLVSKTFYAFALPIAARHFCPWAQQHEATRTLQILQQARSHFEEQGVPWAVESLLLPEGLLDDEEQAFFRSFPRLRTLRSFSHTFSSPNSLPCSLTTLIIESGGTLSSADLTKLTSATPHFTALSLEGAYKDGDYIPLYLLEPSSSIALPPWRLQPLALAGVVGSKKQALALVTSSSATLRSLKLHWPWVRRWVTEYTAVNKFLERLHTPLPALRHLDLGEAGSILPLPDRAFFPIIEELHIPVRRNTLQHVVHLSLTLRRVSFLAYGLQLGATSSRAVETLKTFVSGRPALQCLLDDCEAQLENQPLWYADLQAKCEARGILFAGNSLGVAGEEDSVWVDREQQDTEMEEEADRNEEFEEDLDAFDFDAEDGEEWAHLWSEEKRQAMGLGGSFSA